MVKYLWLLVKLYVFVLFYVNVVLVFVDLEIIGNGICSSSFIEEVRNLLVMWKIEFIFLCINIYYIYSMIIDFENILL